MPFLKPQGQVLFKFTSQFSVMKDKSSVFFRLKPYPPNICLEKDVLKTSFIFIFKTFSRRLDQDEYTHLSHTSSEDVFKTSSRCLGQNQYIGLGHTSSRRLQDVFKTSSRHLQDVLPRHFQGVFKTFSRRLVKTSSRHLQDVFKMF